MPPFLYQRLEPTLVILFRRMVRFRGMGPRGGRCWFSMTMPWPVRSVITLSSMSPLLAIARTPCRRCDCIVFRRAT